LLVKGFGVSRAVHPSVKNRQNLGTSTAGSSNSIDIKDKLKSALKRSLKRFGLSDDDVEKITNCVLQRLSAKME